MLVARASTNGILLCWYHHDLVRRRTIDIRRRSNGWAFTDARGAEITADDVLPPGAAPGSRLAAAP